jgi:hypothetical protein
MDVPVEQDNLNYTECPNCKTKLGINVDADFVDGQWIDLTFLYKADSN